MECETPVHKTAKPETLVIPHPLFDLTGKIGLVTGAASGLGFAMAEALAENGADVIIADIDADAAAAASDKLTQRGLHARSVVLDVAVRGAPAALVRAIMEHEGRLDIAFANAGISAGPGPFSDQGKIGAVSPERWARVLDVNLSGVFETIQAVAEPMQRQGSGRIIVTTSTAGFRADPMVGYAYVATKAAVVNLVRQAAVDLARFNVLVNGIAPGPFRTNIGGGRMHDPETDRSFAESLPIGRVGRPEEIKGVALLLASSASSFMTGAIVPVDGGALSW
jgi:NAD(P)-dependent dehydrogenase (short-subunit alcohol dehydrogenase family)